MKNYVYIFVMMLIISLVSCSSENEENFNYSYDILQNHLLQIPETMQVIDFTKTSEAYDKYLLHGWYFPEASHTWASQHVKLCFYNDSVSHDLQIDITWSAIPSKNNAPQMADVILNGSMLGTYPIEHDWMTTRVVLSASTLKTGINILEFVFSYTEKPDARELSVAFQKILFHQEPAFQKFNSQELSQKANSNVNVFVELPNIFELDITYQSFNKAAPRIEIIGEHTKTITIDLPPDKTNMKKKINLPQKGVYKMNFVTEGSEESYIVWKNVRLNMQKPGETPPDENSGFSKRTKPDILLYVVDTLRADHLGAYGYSRETSPHIDAFAKENVLYQNAYSTCSWTRASGASIVTGLLPRNHRTMTRQERLPDELVTLAEILQENGYYTVFFNTNGNICQVFGFDQGFNEPFHFLRENGEFYHVLSDEVNDNVFHFLDGYLKKGDRKPLFLFIWTTDPHDPYIPPEYVRDLFDIHTYTPVDTRLGLIDDIRDGTIQLTASQIEFVKARYDQEIFANDTSFGNLLDRLKALGLYKDMLILFTADHGEEFFEHGGAGHGLTLYNEQIRIPLIMKTDRIAKGVYKEKAQTTDIYPTILDILDITPPYSLDGISLLNLSQSSERMLYFEEKLDGNDLFSNLDNKEKLIFNRKFHRPPTTEKIPLIELYDAADIQEDHNLSTEGFDDYFRLQQLVSYINGKNLLDVQSIEVEIPPKLDQRLKDLGYVR